MMHYINRSQPVDRYKHDIRALCQYSECLTSTNKMCKFPFRYKGRLYDTCITLDSEVPWCSLETDIDDNHIETDQSQGLCQSTCHVQNCPVGFFFFQNSCFLISARIGNDLVREEKDGKEACNTHGATLYKPRDYNSFDLLLQHFDQYLKPGGRHFPTLSSSPADHSFTLIDGQKNASNYDFADGSPAGMVERRVKEDGGINLGGDCSVINQQGKVAKKNCIHSHNSKVGYLCEAMFEETIDGPDIDNMCTFPFKEETSDELRYSCSYHNETMGPWCATEVDENGKVLPDKWGYCKDRRIIAYKGDGSGSKCILPFLHNRVWYDKCAKEMEKEIWCPTKLNPSKLFNETIDEVGYCTDYLNPSSSGCPPSYNSYESICLRVSPYAETYQDAFDKCESEGASLISIDHENLTLFLYSHIRSLEREKLYFKPEYSPDISSYWIGGYTVEQKWMWLAKEKSFSYTNWKDAEENAGCLSSICTDNYALTLNTKSQYTWEASDKSNIKPYICESKCKGGFVWLESLLKCVYISDVEEPTSLITAMYQCALRNARLLQFQQCEEITKASFDIWKTIQQDDVEFWIGYHGGDFDFYESSRLSEITRLSLKLLSSSGYNSLNECPEMTLGDFANGQYNAVYHAGNYTLNTANIYFEPNADDTMKNYICEENKQWMCPDGFILFQEECYSFIEMDKEFTEAQFYCKSLNSHLAEPATTVHDSFLQKGIKENLSDLKVWTGYRKNLNSTNPLTFFSTNSLTESKLPLVDLSGEQIQFYINNISANFIFFYLIFL